MKRSIWGAPYNGVMPTSNIERKLTEVFQWKAGHFKIGINHCEISFIKHDDATVSGLTFRLKEPK